MSWAQLLSAVGPSGNDTSSSPKSKELNFSEQQGQRLRDFAEELTKIPLQGSYNKHIIVISLRSPAAIPLRLLDPVEDLAREQGVLLPKELSASSQSLYGPRLGLIAAGTGQQLRAFLLAVQNSAGSLVAVEPSLVVRKASAWAMSSRFYDINKASFESDLLRVLQATQQNLVALVNNRTAGGVVVALPLAIYSTLNRRTIAATAADMESLNYDKFIGLVKEVEQQSNQILFRKGGSRQFALVPVSALSLLQNEPTQPDSLQSLALRGVDQLVVTNEQFDTLWAAAENLPQTADRQTFKSEQSAALADSQVWDNQRVRMLTMTDFLKRDTLLALINPGNPYGLSAENPVVLVARWRAPTFLLIHLESARQKSLEIFEHLYQAIRHGPMPEPLAKSLCDFQSGKSPPTVRVRDLWSTITGFKLCEGLRRKGQLALVIDSDEELGKQNWMVILPIANWPL